MKTSPAPTQNTSSATFISSVCERSLPCTNWTQGLDSRNESKPVLPKSTATTAISPGRASMLSRLASGLRTIRCPSRIDQGETLPIREEKTSNGSARSKKPEPKTAPPTSITAR